jgi:hypothetical protein
LESIQQYNVLSAYLVDFQTTTSSRAGLETIYGCTSNRAGVTIPLGGCSSTFCMPIISGVVGNLCEKMLSLSLADDLRLEFTLEGLTQSAVGSIAIVSPWSITSWELELNILELGDEGMNMVESITPFNEPIYIHGSSYRHYSSSLANGVVGTQSTLIPARFASLKQIIMCPRRVAEAQTAATAAVAYSISSRICPNVDSSAFRCGSLMVPQKQVFLKNSNTTGGYSEAFMELLKSQHSNADSTFAPSVTRSQYYMGDVTDASNSIVGGASGANSYGNAFAIAQEFESISNRNDIMLSGTNTLNLQLFHDYTIGTAFTGGASYVVNYYALYDHIIVLDPTGLLSVKF